MAVIDVGTREPDVGKNRVETWGVTRAPRTSWAARSSTASTAIRPCTRSRVRLRQGSGQRVAGRAPSLDQRHRCRTAAARVVSTVVLAIVAPFGGGDRGAETAAVVTRDQCDQPLRQRTGRSLSPSLIGAGLTARSSSGR